MYDSPTSLSLHILGLSNYPADSIEFQIHWLQEGLLPAACVPAPADEPSTQAASYHSITGVYDGSFTTVCREPATKKLIWKYATA